LRKNKTELERITGATLEKMQVQTRSAYTCFAHRVQKQNEMKERWRAQTHQVKSVLSLFIHFLRIASVLPNVIQRLRSCFFIYFFQRIEWNFLLKISFFFNTKLIFILLIYLLLFHEINKI